MGDLRVLTFNFHEPYLWLMAKTGYDFAVGQYERPDLARQWHTQYRPLPQNMQLLDERVWRDELEQGRFDVVIAHNENNALDLLKCRVPKILVCHNRKTFLKTTVDGPEKVELFEKLLDRLREAFRFVFISESKRADYGLPGDVIRPGIDVREFGGYTGERPEILRVGNMMRTRRLMFDVDFQEQVCAGLSSRVVGLNPDIPGSHEAESFDELLAHYRSCRCLLHVTREEYEDGYNLSMLEAMACGMPVVALANATCPLTDGIDGLVAPDAAGIRARLETLLRDPELARVMGAQGRETVAHRFPIDAFVENWRRVIETAADKPAGGCRMPGAYEPGGYYCQSRAELAQFVPLTARSVLDVGCGAGEFGRLLKQQGVREVVGIEYVERAWAMAKQSLDQALLGDIEKLELPFPDGRFDCITFNDVVEHLHEPAAAVRKTARCLAPDGIVLMSIPNVRFYEVILMLAAGRWAYSDAGILDRTHLRFFTSVEMRRLVEDAGLELLDLIPLLVIPPERFLAKQADGSLVLGNVSIKPRNETDLADLCTYQYLVIAGKPGGDRLSKAKALLAAGQYKQAHQAALQARGVDEVERVRVAGAAAEAMGRLGMAEKLYRQAIQLRPGDPCLAGALGLVLVRRGKEQEARPLLEQAIHGGAKSPALCAALARGCFAERRHDLALPMLVAAMEEDYSFPDLVPMLIASAEELGRLADAAGVALRYADFYPGNIDVACACAELLLKLGRRDEARGRVQDALFLAPDNVRARELMRRMERS